MADSMENLKDCEISDESINVSKFFIDETLPDNNKKIHSIEASSFLDEQLLNKQIEINKNMIHSMNKNETKDQRCPNDSYNGPPLNSDFPKAPAIIRSTLISTSSSSSNSSSSGIFNLVTNNFSL
jgi:hypothetical protein